MLGFTITTVHQNFLDDLHFECTSQDTELNSILLKYGLSVIRTSKSALTFVSLLDPTHVKISSFHEILARSVYFGLIQKGYEVTFMNEESKRLFDAPINIYVNPSDSSESVKNYIDKNIASNPSILDGCVGFSFSEGVSRVSEVLADLTALTRASKTELYVNAHKVPFHIAKGERKRLVNVDVEFESDEVLSKLPIGKFVHFTPDTSFYSKYTTGNTWALAVDDVYVDELMMSLINLKPFSNFKLLMDNKTHEYNGKLLTKITDYESLKLTCDRGDKHIGSSFYETKLLKQNGVHVVYDGNRTLTFSGFPNMSILLAAISNCVYVQTLNYGRKIEINDQVLISTAQTNEVKS